MESKLKAFDDFMKVQQEMDSLKKNEDNPFFKSKYVPLNQVLRVVKPVLHKNNFIVEQEPCVIDGESCLKTRIIHKSGEEFTGTTKLPSKDSNDPQKIGGSITYMRRYSLCSMLGLEEEDDDGNDASKDETLFFKIKRALQGAKNEATFDKLWGEAKKRKKELNDADWAEIEKIGNEEKGKHVRLEK
jgi:hypothetical protein